MKITIEPPGDRIQDPRLDKMYKKLDKEKEKTKSVASDGNSPEQKAEAPVQENIDG
jgi:hypothetical protein